MTRRLGWRGGALFVVMAIIVGTLVGMVVDRASSAPAPNTEAQSPAPCNACIAQVDRPREGVRKFKRDQLGKAHNVRYTKKQKRAITNALVEAQRKLARKHPTARLAAATRAQLWRNFTDHDNCYFKVLPGSPSLASWTCDGTYRDWPDDADWTGDDIDAVICSGVAGIGVGGALAAGLSGPWTWAGIGAGWAACMWQDNLKDYADSHRPAG
jgi:hypothetical protein